MPEPDRAGTFEKAQAVQIYSGDDFRRRAACGKHGRTCFLRDVDTDTGRRGSVFAGSGGVLRGGWKGKETTAATETGAEKAGRKTGRTRSTGWRTAVEGAKGKDLRLL